MFADVSWRHPALFSASQAGFVNNLNDGVAWGLLPLFFAGKGLGLGEVGLLAAIYPGVWGVTQIATGAISDAVGRKSLIAAGMALQASALAALVPLAGFLPWLVAMAALGLGTAFVYPALLAVVSDVVHPIKRASATGVYRFWRDAGYLFGALLAGTIADLLGIEWAIEVVATLTLASGLVVFWRLPERIAPVEAQSEESCEGRRAAPPCRGTWHGSPSRRTGCCTTVASTAAISTTDVPASWRRCAEPRAIHPLRAQRRCSGPSSQVWGPSAETREGPRRGRLSGDDASPLAVTVDREEDDRADDRADPTGCGRGE